MYNTQFNNIFPSLYFSHGIRVFVRDIWEKKIPWSSHQVAYSGDYTSCLASSLFRWVCAKTNTTIRFSKPPRLKPSQVFRQQMCHAPADTRVPVSAWVHVPVRARYSSQLLTIYFFCCCVRRQNFEDTHLHTFSLRPSEHCFQWTFWYRWFHFFSNILLWFFFSHSEFVWRLQCTRSFSREIYQEILIYTLCQILG